MCVFASCLSKPHRFEKMKLICPLSYEEILGVTFHLAAKPTMVPRMKLAPSFKFACLGDSNI